jgi:hypothetical protein
MKAALMDRGGREECLFYRSPAAVGDEKSRPVSGSGRGNRRVFVQDLESVELDDILPFMLRIGIELAKRELLEALHRGRRIGVDPNRVPRFEDLGAELKRGAGRRSQLERVLLCAKSVDPRARSSHP